MRLLPLNFSTELIFKFNKTNNSYKVDIPDWVEIKKISEVDLNKILADKHIIEYCKFRKSRGFEGILLFNINNKELMAYAFYSLSISPPTNIPKIPKNGSWLFNDFVCVKYRGNGLQKLLIELRVMELININKDINIYTDIVENNIASIKSYLKSGFIPYGKYYLFSIGIRRYKFLSLKFGFWNKKYKHNKVE